MIKRKEPSFIGLTTSTFRRGRSGSLSSVVMEIADRMIKISLGANRQTVASTRK